VSDGWFQSISEVFLSKLKWLLSPFSASFPHSYLSDSLASS
jgi:hypothetical protein